jgi:hypothetical protein
MNDETLEILVAAYQADAPAWRLCLNARERKRQKMNRDRAQTCILKIAAIAPEKTFSPDIPFSSPVRCVLG